MVEMAPTEQTHVHKRPRVGERTLLACLACKQRKLKCDGGAPHCQNCAKTQRDCLVEDPATGLHRPRNYLQSLEAHLAHLETLLQEARPDVALDHLRMSPQVPRTVQSPADASPIQMHFSPSIHQDGLASAGRLEDGGDVDDLSSDVAMLCISATGCEPQYFGPSSALSFSRIASQAMGLTKRHDSMSTASSTPADRPQILTSPRQLRWPSPSIADQLSSAYFTNIHPQYPFLHRATFRTWEAACRTASNDDTIASVDDVPAFFVLMVYAIGALAFGPSRYNLAEDLYALALDRIAPVLDLDSIESVQSILCCAVYSIRSPVGASLWKVSGLAIRHCVELGYHRSAERYRRTGSALIKEMSKRCFWVAYDIDRVVSCVLGRPLGIADRDIDAELPSDVDDEQLTTGPITHQLRGPADPPSAMSGAIHGIKLRRLWSKFSEQLYTQTSIPYQDGLSVPGLSVEGLRKELEDWRAGIPAPVERERSQPLSVFASREWFDLAYHHSILLLYRPYVTNSHTLSSSGVHHATDHGIVERAFQECFAKAREMCLLYRKLYQKPSIQFTWGSLHILFLGGLTYLYCLWRSESVRRSARHSDVINTCMACNTVLVIIAERWNMATSYRDIFSTLSERTISMLCGESSGPSKTAPAPEEGHQSTHDQQVPLDDWLTTLGELAVPESQWFMEQLVDFESHMGTTGQHVSADDFTQFSFG